MLCLRLLANLTKKTNYFHMKSSILKLLTALSLIILFAGKSFGQQYNTIYWLQGIPQASYSNPALMPQPRFYFGMPAISSVYGGAGNSGFAFRDLLRKDALDNFYWDVDYMLGRLKNQNILDMNVQADILSFGFRAKQAYLSFNISEKLTTRLAYPKDLITLMANGNDYFREAGRPGNFSGLGVDFAHYREFGLSYARQFGDRISAGIRLKALQGMAVIGFEQSNIQMVTDPINYNLLVNADLLVNISSPVSLIPIDSLNSNFTFEFDAADYLSNTKNLGGAIDIGLAFKVTDKLTIAFSAIDLGMINWTGGTENFSLKGEFEFEGLNLASLINDNGSGSQNLLDSIRRIFDIEETTRNFSTTLPAKFYLSAAFDLSPRHKIALLSKTEFYKAQLHPSFTVSYNVRPIHAFSLALSYSVIHFNYHNFGAGFNLNLGPLQLYAVSNNLFGAVQPHTAQAANLHLGLNWVFGYRPKKEDVAPSINL